MSLPAMDRFAEEQMSISWRRLIWSILDKAQEIPHKDDDSDLADGWHIDGCSLLDIREEVLAEFSW